MAARWGATAQREAAQETVAEPVVAEQVTWGELGCPKDIGLYPAGGGQGSGHGSVHIRVKRIHIIVAEDDPSALFTVVAFCPPLGPPEFILGHRVA